MTQYLITTFTDSSGQAFTEATKARENQTFTVVEAESKEEALLIAEGIEVIRKLKEAYQENGLIEEERK
ncbi:DUF1381 domain-containing protein [Staphylococcus delphini]|uniref:DUF1381 domain-containing protein n=1 Tax=Staphylococcus delphini TaxID=53344 RepID=UPI0021D215C4|nr:DUF1381 domain-containing protein [Staphylococcus delphini]UXS43557.1 DUF1381 domain-containing protein [Staphylococcus delphini]UXV44250.1 DUF1381 domain-containing protein [Staphylococcus delphini]